MEEQKRIQQLLPETNGKHSYAPVPLYQAILPEVQTDEFNLRQLLAMVRRRAFVIAGVTIAVSSAVVCLTFFSQPVYEGRFRLLVEPVTKEDNLEELTAIPQLSKKLEDDGLDYDSQLEVLRSPEIMAPIIKKIATRYPDITYKSLLELENLKIERFKETKVLEISYKDPDPQKIEFILQHLSKGFLKYSLEQRQTNLRQGVQFVESQLPILQLQVNQRQEQLKWWRQRYEFVDPELKAQEISNRLSEVQIRKLDTEKQLAQTRAFYKALQGSDGAQLAQAQVLSITLDNKTSGSESSSESPVYQKLVSQLRDIDSQISSEINRYREDSPHIERLRHQRQNLLPLLQQEASRVLKNKLVEVGSQVSLLQVRFNKLAQAESQLNQQVKQLPTIARRYSDLQRELNIATESLNRFLEKRQSLQIEVAQKEIPWQVIATPKLEEDPVSPKIPRNLILGGIASILAGLGAASLLEKLDNVFHSSEELKEATKLPVLGVIPFHKNLGKTAIEETNQQEESRSRRPRNAYGYNYFPFLESFRSLYTNIGFLGSDTPVHSLVISSSVHAEGKSTTATFLAQAAAAMGRRVLLVDADLRLPQIHRILKLSNDTGLSNAISTNVPVADLIQRSPAWENLFILTAGQIPPDPTKLLSSHKMRNIMEQLRQQYDLVIYDTPPMLGLADASLLAPYTAGLAIVTRMDKTDRAMLTQTLDQLKLSRTQVLGAICNGVKDYKATTSYYHYYYQPRTQSAG